MNLAISDTRTDYPEGVAYALERDGASLVRFNHTGNLLAVGTSDGSVLVADLDTKGFAREFVGHVAPVTSLSWARSSKHVLSSSKDWNCILWNLSNAVGAKEFVLRFGSPVLQAVFHPMQSATKCRFRTLVSCLNQYPYICTLAQDDNGVFRETRELLVKLDDGQVDITKNSEYIQTTVVSFDTSGEYIFLGNAKGVVTVLENETRKILLHFRPSGLAAIKGFQFSPDRKLVAVISAEKTLRCYYFDNIMALDRSDSEIQTLEPDFRYFDSVDQNRWVQCAFSSNTKYFIGGSAVKNSHKVYIWEQESGALVKLLEIQKDNLLDIAWHPKLPILVSVSSGGVINVWTVKIHENWSAFAPDFRELDENVEYEELEDEFDIIDESQKKLTKGAEEEEDVDIMTCDDINEDEVFYIPMNA